MAFQETVQQGPPLVEGGGIDGERAVLIDSSALAKRHVSEVGSTWVEELCERKRGGRVHVSRLAIAEVVSAVCRRCREGVLTEPDREDAIRAFLASCDSDYEIVEVDAPVVESAIVLLRRHALRASDAVHLATATALNRALASERAPRLLLISADARLCEFARAEGLTTENPNDHPSPND